MSVKSKFYLFLAAILIIGLGYDSYDKSKIKKTEEARNLASFEALKTELNNNKGQLIQNASSLIKDGKPEKAIMLLSKYQKVNDADLSNIRDHATVESILINLKKLPVEKYRENLALYNQLTALRPEEKSFQDKVSFYQGKVNAENGAKAKKEAREKELASAFSAWDGSHKTLERYVISNMNDPDSYEHVETKYIDKGDHLVLITRFRGKNGFGGTVVNSISAKAKLSGEIIEIIN
jgi:hypothetical protein